MSESKPSAPTHTGVLSGCEPSSGMTWAFESPETHWAAHDVRQAVYWRNRSPEERLAQAAEYRRRRHGDISEPSSWSWRFLPPGGQ